MKSTAVLTAIVIGLSTIIWVAFYYAFPDNPLDKAETTLIAIVVAAIAVAVRAIILRLASKKDVS